MKRVTWLLISLTFTLQGCSTLGSLWAGDYKEELAKSEGGAIASNPLTRQPIKLKSRQSKSAAISEDAAQAITAVANLEIEQLKLERIRLESSQGATTCTTMTPEQIAELTKEGEVAYFQNEQACRMFQFMNQTTNLLAGALTAALKGESDVANVANSFMSAVANVEREGTNKLRAIVNPLAISIGVRERERTARNGQDAFAGAVADAAAVGNTTTGDIFVGDNVSGSADSNDGGLASSNDGGFGEGGAEGLAGAGGSGSGVGGDGSGTSTNTSGGNTNVFTLGNNNSVGLSQDAGRSFVDTRGTQQLEPSANGGVNDDSNVDQQPIIDSNTDSDLSNDPENGSNNSLF